MTKIPSFIYRHLKGSLPVFLSHEDEATMSGDTKYSINDVEITNNDEINTMFVEREMMMVLSKEPLISSIPCGREMILMICSTFHHKVFCFGVELNVGNGILIYLRHMTFCND